MKNITSEPIEVSQISFSKTSYLSIRNVLLYLLHKEDLYQLNIKTLRLITLFFISLQLTNCSKKEESYKAQTIEALKDSVLSRVKENLKIAPVTITAYDCSRNSYGLHDFYSEGDY